MTRAITISEIARTHGSPAQVWRLLGDFGNEHRWSSQLASCRRDTAAVAVGTRRTCTLAKPLMGRTETTEELTEYVAGASLAYRLSGRAGPFRVSEGRWLVTPDEGVTVITVSAGSSRSTPLSASLWDHSRRCSPFGRRAEP
jgi:Polyketide cyclase / dehydrase and lipid transport